MTNTRPSSKARRVAPLVFIAAMIPVFSACELISARSVESVWVHTDPIQCLGNPWQQDWLKRNEWRYEDYPSGQELSVFRSYYERMGIHISKVRVERIADLVCAACSCSTGARYYVLTDERGAEQLKALGFREGGP